VSCIKLYFFKRPVIITTIPPLPPPQVWATYSPVKNSAADARAKAAEGNPTHSATVAEMDLYRCNATMLELLAGAFVCRGGRRAPVGFWGCLLSFVFCLVS
jgi:hypothetical protein